MNQSPTSRKRREKWGTRPGASAGRLPGAEDRWYCVGFYAALEAPLFHVFARVRGTLPSAAEAGSFGDAFWRGLSRAPSWSKVKIKVKGKGARVPAPHEQSQRQSQNQDQRQRRRTGVSDPHDHNPHFSQRTREMGHPALIAIKIYFFLRHRLTHRVAGMAKLADAADLKSAGAKALWGFDSPSRHQLIYPKTST
jgi:hypothetical protein